MNINFSDLIREIWRNKDHNNEVLAFIEEVERGLDKMKNNIKEFTIDRLEEDIAVCENRDTKEILNIKVQELPKGIKEGSILTYKDGKFEVDKEKEQEVENRIKEKMDNLWNN